MDFDIIARAVIVIVVHSSFENGENGTMLFGYWLGRIPVQHSEQLLDELSGARSRDEIPDVLLFYEHPPTFAFHKHREERDRRSIRDPEWYDFYRAQYGIAETATSRGGGMMYHGPGQLIIAPVMKLRTDFGIDAYQGSIVAAMRRFLKLAYNISSFRVQFNADSERWESDNGDHVTELADERRLGAYGVWVLHKGTMKKIGFLGSRVQRGVVSRGGALNLSPSLKFFELIDPCNLPGVKASSVLELTRLQPPMDAVLAERMAFLFADTIGRAQELQFLRDGPLPSNIQIP